MPPRKSKGADAAPKDANMEVADDSDAGRGDTEASSTVAGTGLVAADGKPPDETDNANYFCEYAYLYHQMDMLEDSHRTGSYYNAVMYNPGCFEGKVVLDVGAGSGILSIMAAKCKAKKVFAVEATDMAKRARKIVEGNGLSDVIEVLQGTVETVQLPCKVDVIISEWMGYLLLRESMLDSVLVARDKFLKPGGAMFPSHATLYLAPVGQLKVLKDKATTFAGEKQHFASFAADMKNWYDTDFSFMDQEFLKEQRKYYLQTGAFVNLVPKNLVGLGRPLMEMDLHTISLEELKNPTEPLQCSLRISRDGPVEGFTGYFDTIFRGSRENCVEQEVTLTTAPTVGTATHWGQQLFGFYPPLQAKKDDTLECEVFIRRQEHNHRLLKLQCKFALYAAAPTSTNGGSTSRQRVLREQREEV